jgi:hypothetical protein
LLVCGGDELAAAELTRKVALVRAPALASGLQKCFFAGMHPTRPRTRGEVHACALPDRKQK